jgi:prolyl-tRNA synthetase
VVIIPIGRDADIAGVLAAAGRLAAELTAAGVRVRVDDRSQLSVGFKFNEWELRGAPLRLELGPRDLSAGVVTLASRLGGEKEQLPLESVAASIPRLLEQFQADLLARANAFADEHTVRADDAEGLASAVATGFASALHCGRPECEDEIKQQTTATPRCIPTHAPAEEGICAWCGLPSAYGCRILFARAY